MIVPSDIAHLKSIAPGRILGIDFGEKRIGLALSDPFQMTASPLETVPNRNMETSVAQIAETALRHAAKALVVGKPLHMSGESSAMSLKVEAFAQQLAEALTDTPVFFWDERWSTASAEKIMIETGQSPSRNRQKIDQVAAAYMLTGFLQRLDILKRSAGTESPLEK